VVIGAAALAGHTMCASPTISTWVEFFL